MTTLADLQSPQTANQIFATLLGVYQANGFPTQSWQPFGVERTRLMAFATALADVSGNYIPAAAGGGFLDYASTNWLRLTAVELYNLLYNAATQTQGNVLMTVAAGAGPYTYTAGSIIIVFGATGNRYINVNAGTLSAGPSATSVLFRAEFAGASYSDPSNSGAITLVTPPMPGVTLTNPAGTFSPVAVVGAGTGSVSPSGSPVSPHQVTIRIDSSGAAGVAAWSYSLDGAPYVSVGALASAAIGGSGITATLNNGVSGTSFVLGDTHTFACPGTWVTVQGSDDESDLILAQRCKARWSTLSPIPTNSFYQLIAQSTPGVGSQVTQVVVLNDTVINNQVNIVVAGPAGVLPPATVAAIQTYINSRVPITDKPVVVSPSTLNVTYAGVITCSASQLAAVQSAVQTAMTNYTNAVGINGTARLAAITDRVMEAGATDITGLTINGVAANLTLGSSTTFVLPVLQPLAFSYVTTA